MLPPVFFQVGKKGRGQRLNRPAALEQDRLDVRAHGNFCAGR
jgi:hypothetical protein